MPAISAVLAQVVANYGLMALQAAMADPEPLAVEPKVDGVRGWWCSTAMGSSKYAIAADPSRLTRGQGLAREPLAF